MKNRKVLLVLSGQICAGKSTLAKAFRSQSDYEVFMTREILKSLAPAEFLMKYDTEREGLINYSIELDKSGDGSWISDSLPYNTVISSNILLDSVRLPIQLDVVRNKFFATNHIIHIHLKCSNETARSRFGGRNENNRINTRIMLKDFGEANLHPIELQISELSQDADLTINTDALSKEEVYLECLKFVDKYIDCHSLD